MNYVFLFSKINLFYIGQRSFVAKMFKCRVLKQGYRYHNIRKAFSKLYRRHHKLIAKFNVGLKSLLPQGLSEKEFYGDLVYKFKKIMRRTEFSDQFRIIIIRHKRIGYDLNVMRQSACLVMNPILVDNVAAILIARRWIGRQTLSWPRPKAFHFSWFCNRSFRLLLGPPGLN